MNWKEKFEQKHWGAMFESGDYDALLDDIDALLSSQEQKHRKEMEELIEDVATAKVEATKPLTDKESREKAELITPILQEWLSPLAKQLKSKYLTKGKE